MACDQMHRMTAAEADRIIEREVCRHCGIEPRLASEFVCWITDCPERTVKIRKTYADWLWRKKRKGKRTL